MKKKFLLTLLCVGALSGGLTLSAWSCGTDTPNKPGEPDHEHRYVETVVEPTCQDKGYVLYKCECGEDYKDNYTEVVAHSYKDGKCIWCGSENLKPTEGLEFTLSDDGSYYSVTGIGTATDKNIVIPSTYNEKPVTAIGDYAFDWSDLTSITIPDSVTEIGWYAFRGCERIKSINYMGDIAGWCEISRLYELMRRGSDRKIYIKGRELIELVIPDEVTLISDYAFAYCSGLTEIAIPDSVTKIGDAAFICCRKLRSITIPDSVTSIGELAFGVCSGLLSVTIGNGVTTIGKETFYDCNELTDIRFNGTKDEWKAIKKGSNWDEKTGNYTVHCTDGDISKSES
ncbi:MAG: leucine-rich repeat domain-containing protein [Clostridia bacterium]|nr:leucine-rich repeat domain-containing protein [Clostridia bacterium]